LGKTTSLRVAKGKPIVDRGEALSIMTIDTLEVVKVGNVAEIG
jgi:hypothetical protein